MAEKRAPLDLWQLFSDGRSGGVALGEADVACIRKAFGARSHGHEGQAPFSAWVLATEQAECYFQGQPPRFYSIKIHPSLKSLSSEAAEVLDGEGASQERAGLVSVVLDGKPLSLFSTIRRLLKNCPAADRLAIRSDDEKMLSFSIVDANRSIHFGYRAETRRLYHGAGIFDLDYFLYAVWVFDMGADAELSRALPAGTETRDAVLSRVANAGRGGLDREQSNN